MMDPEIARVLREAEETLALVNRHQQENLIILIVGGVLLGLLCWYFYERWTWIPRKKHNRVFVERF